jgi:hypothetical protein
MAETFEITPAGQKAFIWLLVVTAFVVVTFCSLLIVMASTMGVKPIMIVGPVFFLVALLMVYILRASRHTTFELGREHLRIRGDLFGRTIPIELLDPEKARLINLNDELGYKPKWKTCGTTVPGYQSGKFKLKNGESAWIYLTDRSKVVYIPTKKRYAVMMSVTHPERMLEELRGLSGHQGN